MKTLLARVTNDGYLLSTTDDLNNGRRRSFWADYYEEGMDDFSPETVEIKVPENLVDALLKHGTSEQIFSDGYEAWQEVLKQGGIK